MNRREFLSWVGIGGIASYLPIAITACSNNVSQTNSESVSTTPTRSDGFVPIGNMSDLKQKGQISQGEILIIASTSAPNEVMAVNSSCTHAGCAVTWDKEQTAFVCPCHHSQFASDGKVLKGPAKEPLPTYTTKIEGEQILVKTS